MMTNLIASIVVTVVTNTAVIEPENPAVYIQSVPLNGIWNGFSQRPQERNVRTTCKELTTLTFEWNGPQQIVKERVIWESNVVQKLDWVAK